MMYFSLAFACSILVLLLGSMADSVRGDCWDTGCQLNSWAVVGCSQYGRVETGRRPCNGGNIYTCCTSSGGGSSTASPPPSGDTKYGDITYYNLGMTACGVTFSDNDLVAAIAFSYWTTANPNVDPICGRQALVKDPSTGRSVTVKIYDKCSGCGTGDIDLSPAAFQQLRPLGDGRFKGEWKFI